jgi:nuclear receptor subfamily 1 group D member 3
LQPTSSTTETLDEQKLWLWQNFAKRITPSIVSLCDFAKQVPGFIDFSQDDQLILIKLGFFEVWLSHVAKTASTDANEQKIMLIFDDGYFLTRNQLELMYDVS